MIFRENHIDMKRIVLLPVFFAFLSAQTFQTVIQRLEQSPAEQRQRIIEPYLAAKRFSPIIEQDTLLHFVFYGTAGSVSVNGNLQHWNNPVPLERIPCGTYSLFHKTFVVPSDARLDYQFIVDGKVTLDPHNPAVTPSGFGPHSEARMPGSVPSPYLFVRNDIPRGTIDSLPAAKIPAPLCHYLVGVRPIKVYKPAGYDTLSHLPTIYIHDGFEAITFAHLPTIIDNLIAAKMIPPVIAVFIPPVNRQDEYAGSRTEQFVKYLADDLVPLIDHIYRTEPSPLQRAMIGISGGGHLSLYAGLRRSDVFLNVGGQSSTITPWLTDLTKQRFASNSVSAQMKIYLDCGRYDIQSDNSPNDPFDFLRLNRNYSNLLSSLHIPHYYKEVNDGHEWANWRERMPEMLIYFFGTHL
jgi:enterochelin esterase family protein